MQMGNDFSPKENIDEIVAENAREDTRQVEQESELVTGFVQKIFSNKSKRFQVHSFR